MLCKNNKYLISITQNIIQLMTVYRIVEISYSNKNEQVTGNLYIFMTGKSKVVHCQFYLSIRFLNWRWKFFNMGQNFGTCWNTIVSTTQSQIPVILWFLLWIMLLISRSKKKIKVAWILSLSTSQVKNADSIICTQSLSSL